MRNRVLFKNNNGSACIKWKGVVYLRLKKGESFYYVASETTYTALLSLKHCGKRSVSNHQHKEIDSM